MNFAQELVDLQIVLGNKRNLFNRRVGELQFCHQQVDKLQEEVTNVDYSVIVYGNVISLFNSYGEKEQEELRGKLENLVSYGLQVVFEQPMHFKINMDIARKQVVMELKVESGGIETDIMSARGGGLVAVVGFILQIIIVVLLRKDVHQVLILDEALAQLSAEFRSRMAKFIHEIVDKTGVQVIFVTHQMEYCVEADRVYRFVQEEDGYTRVEQVEK